MQFQYRKIVFLTGAGISAESGLSLFRGKNGLWNNRNPEEVATAEALLQRRSDVLDFYNGLRHEMAEAKPNAAHLAISRLQQGYSGEVYILTQNMDTLHEKAGSENVYHIHGQINEIRCSHCHNIWETWNDITPDMPFLPRREIAAAGHCLLWRRNNVHFCCGRPAALRRPLRCGRNVRRNSSRFSFCLGSLEKRRQNACF